MKCNEYKVTMVRECQMEYTAKIRTPEAVPEFWKTEVEKASWFDPEKEAFVVILLSAKNHIKGYNLVSLGGVDSALVHPREVFRPAIISAASAIIICHNHPSGDATPSAEDIRITRQLVEAGKIVDIKIADHVVIGKANGIDKGFVTMRDSGLVDFC